MKLKDLEIHEDDFDLFVALNPKEKIEFLFDASQIGVEASITKQVDKLSSQVSIKEVPVVSQNFNVGQFKLCVTSVLDEVYLNSNSLKAIRRFVYKLWNDGLIMSRLDAKKTEFDRYRYFRAYKILGKGHPFCPN
jgi:spore cortex formation protein SpoVR/YcgB (stage V sporulation)